MQNMSGLFIWGMPYHTALKGYKCLKWWKYGIYNSLIVVGLILLIVVGHDFKPVFVTEYVLHSNAGESREWASPDHKGRAERLRYPLFSCTCSD